VSLVEANYVVQSSRRSRLLTDDCAVIPATETAVHRNHSKLLRFFSGIVVGWAIAGYWTCIQWVS